MLWATGLGLDGGRGHFCRCDWQQTTPLKDAIKQWVTAPVLSFSVSCLRADFAISSHTSIRFHRRMKWPPPCGCPSNSVRERPLHDCLCVHARRRQPPTIGEYRPIFGASRRKRRGRKRQSLRRSSFTAFCRLSRRFPLLPASNNPGGWAIDSATRGQMDNSLSTLKKCRHLSLSSHSIEKISNLSGLGARTDRPLSV